MNIMRLLLALPARFMLPLLMAIFSLPYGYMIYTGQVQHLTRLTAQHESQRLTSILSDAQTRLSTQLAHNPLLARQIVSGLGLHDNLSEAWLLDETGQIIGALTRRDRDLNIHDLLTAYPWFTGMVAADFKHQNKRGLQLHHLTDPKLLIGHVPIQGAGDLVVVIDLTLPNQNLLYASRQQLFFQIGVLLFMSVLFAVTLHMLWFRRAALLTRIASALGHGKLSARSRLEGNDELASISRSLDSMASQMEIQNLHLQSLGEVMDHSPVVAFVWSNSPGWPATFVSESVNQWGYKPDDFTSSDIQFSSLIHPDDLPRIEAEVSHYIANGPDEYTQEYRIHDASGRWFWIDDRTWLSRNELGEVVSIQGVVLDISEKKHIEQSLRESEERLRLALKSANQGLYDLDMTTGDAKVSPEYATMIGLDPDTFHETHMGWRARLHPDDSAPVFRCFDQYVTGEIPEYRVEFRMLTQDGSWKWILSMGSIVQWSSDGKPLRMLGTHTDISLLKQTEAALRDLNKNLESKVEERTIELKTLNQSLESFVYSVSHDLKAPLRGIEGYCRLLEEDYANKLDADGQLFVTNIRKGASRMGDLIDDLLAYSRMERKVITLRPVKLTGHVHELVNQLNTSLDIKKVSVDINLPDVSLLADPEGLAMVLRNLFENAFKFSSRSDHPEIRINGHDNGDGSFTFSVCDNGLGFDMKYHDRIFEIFQRLHRQEDYSGTGIGLALSKKAVQRMNGKIWAESTPGEGACFFVSLPLAYSEL